MIKNEGHEFDEDTVLFIKREAARETQGTIAAQARAKHLPRPLVDGAQGAQISAHELQVAAPVLDKIKDEALRRTVRGYFFIATKYQALNMLIQPQGRLRQAQPEVLAELINVITSTDRKVLGRVHQRRGY